MASKIRLIRNTFLCRKINRCRHSFVGDRNAVNDVIVVVAVVFVVKAFVINLDVLVV